MKKKESLAILNSVRTYFTDPGARGNVLLQHCWGSTSTRRSSSIGLSQIVSRSIRETETPFLKLQKNKNWILFFDEAEALFGKRTNVKDAHERYAKVEAAYLLQKIENYTGVAILATNMKNHLDDGIYSPSTLRDQFPDS